VGATEFIDCGPFRLEALRRPRTGHSRSKLLLVHGIHPVAPEARFLAALAEFGDIIAPSHPGFGRSPRADDFDTMYDLVRLYLALVDDLQGDDVTMIGFSFGGWIAAEVAVCRPRKLARLILVDPVGVKLGGREERDIAHFFNTAPDDLERRAWHNPASAPGAAGLGWQNRIGEAGDDELVGLARNWDALCLYAWRPHMYNPQLKHWLHQIDVPTLVLWGESDRIVTPDYGSTYAGLIPGARFRQIAAAGHHPELEQPAAFAAAVAEFLGDSGADSA
jgi:pimeloyl-ACP methyl ester carboxylesterase